MNTLEFLWAVRDLEDERLRVAHRAALFALIACRNKDGSVAPSMARLGRAVGLGAKQTRRVVHDLESFGYLAIEDRNATRRQSANGYKLILPLERALPPKGVLTPEGVLPPVTDSDSPPREYLLQPAGAFEDLSEDPLEEERDIAPPPSSVSASEPAQSSLPLTLSPASPSVGPPRKVKDIAEGEENATWAHYRAHLKRVYPRTRDVALDPKSRRRIREAIGRGVTHADMRTAVDGMFSDAKRVAGRNVEFRYVFETDNFDRFLAAGERLKPERRDARPEPNTDEREPDAPRAPLPPDLLALMAKTKVQDTDAA